MANWKRVGHVYRQDPRELKVKARALPEARELKRECPRRDWS